MHTVVPLQGDGAKAPPSPPCSYPHDLSELLGKLA